MRTDPDFILHSLGPDDILTGPASQSGKRRMLRLNRSAAFLWSRVEGKDFSVEDIARLLGDEYGLEPDAAMADALAVTEAWKAAGIAK